MKPCNKGRIRYLAKGKNIMKVLHTYEVFFNRGQIKRHGNQSLPS